MVLMRRSGDDVIKDFTLARYVHRSVLPMKAFFQTLLPKAVRAQAPNARPDGSKPGENSAGAGGTPPKSVASGKPASSVAGESEASERPHLALEAGDFIDRIPHHLLRLGKFDLHKPLLFDMADISNRIARGIFTIPLADLMKALPEMFLEEAQAHHAMEIRFPWQKVMQMVHQSAALQKENGGETLAQKLRRMRKTDKPAAPGAAPDAPAGLRREGNPQFKRGAGRDVESAWFSKRSGTAEDTIERKEAFQKRAIPAPELPEAPASAPALFELPEQTRTNIPPPAQPPAAPPIERAVAAPAPGRAPISDIMDLTNPVSPLAGKTGAGSENRDSIPGPALAPAPASAPAPIPAPAPAESGPKSVAEESELKMNRTRIKFLEAQVKTLTSKHQSELSALTAETDRMMEKLRSEAEKERLDLVTQFQFERQRLAVAKDEQVSRMEAEYRAGVTAQQNQISELRAAGDKAFDKASDGERSKSAADFESQFAELKELEARVYPLMAELESVKAERDQAVNLLLQEEQRATGLASKLEFDLFALRVESAQIVADERERADKRIAEMELRFTQEGSGSPDQPEGGSAASGHERALAMKDLEIAELKADRTDLTNAMEAAKLALARMQAERENAASAASEPSEASRQALASAKEEAERTLAAARAEWERERQQLIAERQNALKEITARAETPAMKKDEALARLQAELENAQALATAQAASHERIAAQWDEDVQVYRKRLQTVIGEKTALTAKLRQAEIALQAGGASTAGAVA